MSGTVDFIGRYVDEMTDFVSSRGFQKDMSADDIRVDEVVRRAEAQVDTRLRRKVKNGVDGMELET